MSITVFDNTAQFTGSDFCTAIQNPGDQAANSFTTPNAGTLSALTICIGNTDFNLNPHSYTVQVDIYNDAGNTPGALLASIDAALVTPVINASSDVLIVVTVPAGINLTQGTRYWIVITNPANPVVNACSVGFPNTAAGTGVAGEFWATNIAGGGWQVNANSDNFPPLLMLIDVEAGAAANGNPRLSIEKQPIYPVPTNRGCKENCGCIATGKMFLKC